MKEKNLKKEDNIKFKHYIFYITKNINYMYILVSIKFIMICFCLREYAKY